MNIYRLLIFTLYLIPAYGWSQTIPATPATSPSLALLNKVKTQQAKEYAKLQTRYDYWQKEVERLTGKPNRTHLYNKAKEEANALAAEAKRIVSSEYLSELLKKEEIDAAARTDQHRATELRKQQEIEAEKQRVQAAIAAEAERQRQAILAEEKRKKEAADRLRALILAQELQEAKDKESWGILSEEKYERLLVGMSIPQVEKIVGPGTNLGSRTIKVGDSQIDMTDYRWICKEGHGILNIQFDSEGLADKQVNWSVPQTKPTPAASVTVHGEVHL